MFALAMILTHRVIESALCPVTLWARLTGVIKRCLEDDLLANFMRDHH